MDRPALFTHIPIYDNKIQRLRDPCEAVSAGELFKLHVRIAKKEVERAPLGNASKFRAIGRTDEVIELYPWHKCFSSALQLAAQINERGSALVIGEKYDSRGIAAHLGFCLQRAKAGQIKLYLCFVIRCRTSSGVILERFLMN